jgi:hypothetical protein
MLDFEQRLLHLETANRRLRASVGFLALIVCAGTMTLMTLPESVADQPNSSPVTDQVRTRRLAVVDAHDKERLVLEVAERKFNTEIKSDDRQEVFATIRVMDSAGTERAALEANDLGLARLKLFTHEGKRRIELAADGEEYAKILIYDSLGERAETRSP